MSRQPVVFFVDDEEGILRFVRRSLEADGCRVLVARSAEEAGRVIDEFAEPIDVLLMDINLPDAWGANLAQTLRLAHPEMRIVYTTGHALADDVLRGGLRDAAMVLQKPFSISDLLAIVERATGNSHG